MAPQIILIVLSSMQFSSHLKKDLAATKDVAVKVAVSIAYQATIHGLFYWAGWYECFTAGG